MVWIREYHTNRCQTSHMREHFFIVDARTLQEAFYDCKAFSFSSFGFQPVYLNVEVWFSEA